MDFSREHKQEASSSVSNALRMLKQFSVDAPEISIREFAERLGIGNSTAHRLLSTLASEGFITKENHSSGYRLSGSILALGHIVMSKLPYQEALPLLERLAKRTGESAHLAVLSGIEVIYLHKIDCTFPVHLLSHLGKRNPVHCTSTGQAILAFQPASVIESFLSHPLKRYSKHTITDPEVFRSVLLNIRNQGYAVSKEELHEGVTSIAAPIRNQLGKVVASVTLAGPIERIHQHTIPRLVQLLMETTHELSSKWGKQV